MKYVSHLHLVHSFGVGKNKCVMVEVSLALAFQLTLKVHSKNTKAINIIHKQNTIQSCGFFLTRCSVPLHFNSPAEFSIQKKKKKQLRRPAMVPSLYSAAVFYLTLLHYSAFKAMYMMMSHGRCQRCHRKL